MHSKPLVSIAPLVGVIGAMLLSSCTFVSLAPEAEAVRVVDEDDTAGYLMDVYIIL